MRGVTVYSADRERGREEFKKALLGTPLGDFARRSHLAVSADGVGLRNGPSTDAMLLRQMMVDTYVKKLEVSGDWTKIRMPEGREGWVQTQFLGPIK